MAILHIVISRPFKVSEQCGLMIRMSRTLISTRQLTKKAAAKVIPKPANPAIVPNVAAASVALKAAPDHIRNALLEELYELMGSTIPQQKPENHYVDFIVPDKYIKLKVADIPTEKDHRIMAELDKFMTTHDEDQLVQAQYNLIKLYYDKDTDLYQPLPAHYLKKLLLGLVSLNPALENIDDEYLWNLFPKDKQFGVRPFQTEGLFKDWEQQMLEKTKKEATAKEKTALETRELMSQFAKTRFFRKLGLRKKLDRKLVKKYKKLRNSTPAGEEEEE